MSSSRLPGIRSGRRRAVPGAAVAALVAALLAPLPSAQATASAPAAGQASDEAAAAALARATGERVEVVSQRTEHETHYANPDGTWRLHQSNDVVRVRRGDGWVAPDATIVHRADGSLGPAAATLDLSLSRGGSEPLARIGRNGVSVAMSWGATLPAPVLDGATATYPEVLPGVDLVVTATTSSFSEVLVVKSREAARQPALRRIAFPVDASGATLRADAGGGFSAVDAAGQPVLVSPQPVMWDSRGARAAGTRPGEGARMAPMRAEVGTGTVAVVPDAAMLADPDTAYPVYLDPTFTAPHPEWTVVEFYYPTTEYYKFGGDAGVGYQNYDGVSKKRQFHSFDTSRFNGKKIYDAKFKIFETHAATCTAREVELWTSDPISSATNWSNKPDLLSYVYSRTVSFGRAGCTYPDPTDVEFEADTAIAAAAAANDDEVTFGLKAGSETDPSYWKRFSAGAELTVDYNTYPDTPLTSSMGGENPAFPCVTGTGVPRPYINDTSPTVKVTVVDDDGGNVRAEWDTGPIGGARAYPMSPTAKASGSEFTHTMTDLDNGVSYSYRVKGWDGRDLGAVSGKCDFTIDTTPPGTAVVTSTDFVEDGTAPDPPLLMTGQEGSFTFAPAAGNTDVDYYRYSFDSDSFALEENPPTLNDPVTLTHTPITAGVRYVTVKAFDRAHNPAGAARKYEFRVKDRPPNGHWAFDDPTRTADDSGANHPVTLTGNATWAGGKDSSADPDDYALSLDGSSGTANTGQQILLTSGETRFTVSAWVNLGSASRTGRYVVASQNGTNASAFVMGFDGTQSDGPEWFAEIKSSDSSTTVAKRAEIKSTAWDAGTESEVDSTTTNFGWAKLTVRYDGTQFRLILNNGTDSLFPSHLVQGTVFSTAATFRIGGGRTGEILPGLVDRVYTFPWNVGDATVTQL